jgi:hypothetical protein
MQYLPALRRRSDQGHVIEAGRALLAGGIVDGRAEAAAAGGDEQQVAFVDIDGHRHGRPQGGQQQADQEQEAMHGESRTGGMPEL